MSERLTDEELEFAEARARSWAMRNGEVVSRDHAINEELLALDALSMLAEIRARRARDLTTEDKEALRRLANCCRCACADPLCRERQPAVSLLDALLNGKDGG